VRVLANRILLVVAALWGGSAVQAASYDATLQVTPPTTRTDGSALPGSAIAGYRIAFNCQSTPQPQGSDKAGPPPLVVPALFPADGTYDVCVAVVDTGGRLSAYSNVMRVVVAEVGPPNAPTLDGITLSCPSGSPPRVISSGPTELRLECDAP
jgi:hypothetical protein